MLHKSMTNRAAKYGPHSTSNLKMYIQVGHQSKTGNETSGLYQNQGLHHVQSRLIVASIQEEWIELPTR
jgi:hypothetical protein